MKRLFIAMTILAFLAGGCAEASTPTATPRPLLPSPTQACVNDPFCQPTETPALTPTVAPAPLLEVSLEGCDWGIDIAHQMGEVTNAYLLVKNSGTAAVTDLCLELFASDEGRPHPDKSRCYLELPAGKQVAVKLTVDTTYGTNTDFYVVVTSSQPTMQTPTQRCQPIKDGARLAYDKVLDVIQDIGK